MDFSTLYLGFVFGMIGLGYLMYGKKATDPYFMVFGFILMGYPYIIGNVFWIVVIGVVVASMPFVMRRMGW